MNEKKYELTGDFIEILGRKLYRIRALRDFSYVKTGDLGGYIENENNLSLDGDAWVYDNASVYGYASVYGDAEVCGDAKVHGAASVCDNAKVCDNAEVCGVAWVYGYASVCNNAVISGDARVYGDAEICDNADIKSDLDYATIGGFGPHRRTTTFFRCKDGFIRVTCEFFYGTIDEFREKVKEIHGDNKYTKEYLMIADLMEMHFAEN